MILPGAEQGWVTTLIAGLKIKLSQKLGRDDLFSLLKDEQLSSHKPFPSEILQALTQSATLLIILSPGYKASKWCLKEMETFWQKLAQRKSSNSRIFVIERDKLEIDEKPKALEELLGYQFWIQDREGKSPRILGEPIPDPHDHLYYDKLGDLAQDLAAELKQLKSLAEKPAELSAKTDERPVVFLAEVTDDLDIQRDQIQRHLDQEGYRVIPAETSHFISYLGGNNKIAETIADDLKNCKLFVQILSGLTGKCRPGQPSFPSLQYQTALEQNILIMQWRDPDLKLEPIESIEHRSLLEGDSVLVIGLEEFKQECVTRLKAQTKKAKPIANPNVVFLNVSTEDFNLGEVVGAALSQHDIGYALPSRVNDPKSIQEDLELWLSECDALIIVYGPSTYAWARAQILRSRRIIGLRDRPLKALAVHEGPPENKESLGIDLPGMLTLNCRQGLHENNLLPFITALLLSTLRRGPLGLIETLQEQPLPADNNLLIVVDQFEEIFHYRQHQNRYEADAFVALLLRSISDSKIPVYVVITMRSDFLGDCALFLGLPEALNDSQFLTPRLAREQRRLAITGPAKVFGGDVEPALVNRLLNDMGGRPGPIAGAATCLDAALDHCH